MVNGAAEQPLRSSYGPVTLLAALANTLIVEFAIWAVLPWFLLAVYVLPLLVIDLLVAMILKSRPGNLGQVGRGMTIGLLAVPAALVMFLPGFMVVQGLGFA